ncbi:hypothetical protein FA95DRAFT_1476512, partial [Auriscalpium vulgare]
EYGEASSKIWTVYMNESQKYDRALVDRWSRDMEGLLIFTGLFSAVLTAFLVESLPLLQLDTGGATVTLLEHMSAQMGSITNTSYPVVGPLASIANPPAAGSPLRVNVLWCLSLLISLLCALCATLVQQWARTYMHAIDMQSAPHQRARIRAFLYKGIEKTGAKAIVEFLPLLLHISMFMFIAGLYDFI